MLEQMETRSATSRRSRSPRRSRAWCRVRSRCCSRRSRNARAARQGAAAHRRQRETPRPIASRSATSTAYCRATSSAPSRTKPASKAGTSATSTSAKTTATSICPRCPTKCWASCRRCGCAAPSCASKRVDSKPDKPKFSGESRRPDRVGEEKREYAGTPRFARDDASRPAGKAPFKPFSKPFSKPFDKSFKKPFKKKGPPKPRD